MKPSARRRGALALLALAGCGVAQNMGQWVGGEHCAGSHCGPSKEEKRLAREEARRLEKARAEVESERGGESIDLATVARKPAAFVLNLSGHHDHPACNGKYTYGGVANGKPQWVKEGGGGEKVFWTGTSWDCFWGGYSPEATVDTPVPPLAGYNKDRGGCDIKVRYQRVTDAGSANGRYPELAGEWRPTRQGQWTRPHQARDRRTVERWDADGRCQYQTEHDIGVIVVVSNMGDEYRCRGESGGARDAPQLIMRTNADGTHSWDLGAWGVEHWQRVTEPEEPGAASGGLREALDGAPRLKLVAAGSDDALRFDNAATLRSGREAPLTANGKNVGLYWSQPRNAWGHWDYIDLGVSEKLRPLRVKLDGPYIVWDGGQGEFLFDVSMWQLHEGRHLVAVKACAGDPGGPTRMSKDAAGRDFVLYVDGTIGPRTATHLRLGVVGARKLRPGWSAHEDIDMAYQGDVEIIHNWREEHSIEDLQRIVERKGYSAISVGSFDHAALKKFPYQLTADHCEPSPGYSNTFYIWGGRGGGGGSGKPGRFSFANLFGWAGGGGSGAAPVASLDAWVGQKCESFPNGQPDNIVETFQFTREGEIYVTTGNASGRNTYTRHGETLQHQQHAEITATLRPNGELAWSHGYGSRIQQAAPGNAPPSPSPGDDEDGLRRRLERTIAETEARLAEERTRVRETEAQLAALHEVL